MPPAATATSPPTAHPGPPADPGPSAVAPAATPSRPAGSPWFYDFMWLLLMSFFTGVYRLRVWHADRVPARGPLLLVANHQSHLDPPAIGMAVRSRRLTFLARSTLFTSSRLFGRAIHALGAVPLKQDAPDAAAMRLTIDLLKQGHAVLVFPEGSRTLDGAMHPFKRGVWLLLSRARCTILPVAIEGAYDAFPRRAARPKFWRQRLGVMVGHPIAADTLLALGPDAGLLHLATTVDALRAQAAARLAASGHHTTTTPYSTVPGD